MITSGTEPVPTVALETHGCKLNQADSSVLAAEFVAAGFRLVDSHEPADVYLVNTCTVTHVADRKARQALRAARRRNPDATVVATGCYAQRAPEALKSLDEVDFVAGNFEKAGLVRKIIEWRKQSVTPCAEGTEVVERVGRNRAVVKIQEGCDQVCAYCIVPKVRGRERSISAADIVRMIERHTTAGYKEIVLTGTQLGSYGFDLSDIDLTGLLRRILAQTKVPRIRVSSVQPHEIDRGLLELWVDPRLCPHFHLALQSGSDTILQRMRRQYTAREYLETAELVRDTVPGASLTTDVIVGFPGETPEDFEETYALCDLVAFASMHVFPYSPRPGTSAAHFSGHVDAATKSQRVGKLIDLSSQHAYEFRRRSLGSTRPVLWEDRRRQNGTDQWVGLTDNYIRVVAESDEPLRNRITPARLVDQRSELVVAEVDSNSFDGSKTAWRA